MLLSMQPLVLILFSFICTAFGDDLIVNTANGRVNGTILKSRLGKDIYSFIGIPFAKPPVGPLRFKAPEIPDPWDDVLDATQDQQECPQIFNSTVYGEEDCLYLNVYSTKLTPGTKRPVVVFFYPGSWYVFTGRSDVFGPEYFLDQDIVLVTSNYRVGVLGFLSTGDGVLAGNQGLKDQVFVLRWVRDNIAAFGGDADQVTLLGYGAGGISVGLHMVSPMSQGLFQRGIMMSGVVGENDIVPEKVFEKQTQFVNCQKSTNNESLECLRNVPFKELTISQLGFYEWAPNPIQPCKNPPCTAKLLNSDPIVWIGPVVESDQGDGCERFLTEDPLESFIDGRFAKDIPLILGYNLNEFQWKGSVYASNETLLQDLNDNWKTIFPLILGYKQNPKKDNISAEFRHHYFNNTPFTSESEDSLGLMFSDTYENYPYYRFAKLIAAQSQAPVYFYHFTYQGRYSFVYKDDEVTPYGVDHFDDLIYLFYIKALFPMFNETDPEATIVEKYTATLYNFIKNGNPNSENSGGLWSPITSDHLQYLEINDSSTSMKEGLPGVGRMALWERLFPF